MSISKSTNTYNRLNWENSVPLVCLGGAGEAGRVDFPILCQTCLGDNPYLRMTKEKYGKECKICVRPFTVFRWCPGAGMRFKKTEICQTCAKLKNICQTCLLDLEFGLPSQVRDTALNINTDMPHSDVNKEYFIQNMEKQIESGATNPAAILSKELTKNYYGRDVLLKLARTSPYYKRNRPQICSFWVKGCCSRGEECPYRHEKPSDPEDPLSNQNFKDRYYGVNDPVAEKLLRQANTFPKLLPSEDKSITTLYVSNLGTCNDFDSNSISENDLRDVFYQFGEIRNITIVPKNQCAFVSYTTREAAVCASEALFQRLIIKGRRLNLNWGKSHSQLTKEDKKGDSVEDHYNPVPGLPPPPPLSQEAANKTDYFNLNSSDKNTASPFPPSPYFQLNMFHPSFNPASQAPVAIHPQDKPVPIIYQAPPPPPSSNEVPTANQIHYPSQNPQRLGSVPESKINENEEEQEKET